MDEVLQIPWHVILIQCCPLIRKWLGWRIGLILVSHFKFDTRCGDPCIIADCRRALKAKQLADRSWRLTCFLRVWETFVVAWRVTEAVYT